MPRLTFKRLPRLKLPQARVLAALRGGEPLRKREIAARVGCSPASGMVTRAMNGVPEGSSSGPAHPGLLALGLAVREELDLDGLAEEVWAITAAGEEALSAWLGEEGPLPPLRDAGSCTNERYRGRSGGL